MIPIIYKNLKLFSLSHCPHVHILSTFPYISVLFVAVIFRSYDRQIIVSMETFRKIFQLQFASVMNDVFKYLQLININNLM